MSEKRHSTNTYTKTTQMLELYDKEFKRAIIKMLQQAITNPPHKKEKSLPRDRRCKDVNSLNGKLRTKK